MLNNFKNKILPSMEINFKSLRFNFMQYLMLVIVFPLTYLVINITSSGNLDRHNEFWVGYFVSLILSVFINMQAQLVSSGNNVVIIETYRSFNVEPIYVYVGQCIVNAVCVIPIFILISLLIDTQINIWLLLFSFCISIYFLSFIAILIGGVIKNPNIASPMLSFLYMVLIIVTPIYTDISTLDGWLKIIYLLNPFTYILVLFYESFSIETNVNIYLAISVIAIISIFSTIFSFKRWKFNKAVEKLSFF